MKQLIKTFGIQTGVFLTLIFGVGIVYAAWDDVVTTGSPLTAESWNEVVNRVKSLSALNGNVGIGIENPTHPLHIVTAAVLERYGNSPHLVLRQSNGSEASKTATLVNQGIGKVSGNSFDGANFATTSAVNFYATENQTVSSRGSAFAITTTPNGSTGEIERLRVNHNGNVGIGTSSPENMLHLVGNSQQAGIIQENTDGSQGGQYPAITQTSYNAGHGALVGQRASGTKDSPGVAPANTTLQTIVGRGYDGAAFQEVGRISIKTGADFASGEIDGALYFQVRDNNQGRDAMVIKENGNIGIGTNNPSQKLHVQNNVGNTTSRASTYFLIEAGSDGLPDAEASVILKSKGSWGSTIEYGTTGASLSQSSLNFYSTNLSGEVARITGDGKLGIGTSSPGSKLSVVGLPSGTSLVNAGLDSSPAGAVCIAQDGDMYIDTDGVCN